MTDILNLIILNLEKIGIGIGLFLGSYLANIFLGAWNNVKIEGKNFDWNLILQSLIKFIVIGIGIGLLSIVISIVPAYLTYIGIEINEETMSTIDSIVIISAFATATLKYINESINKIKNILTK